MDTVPVFISIFMYSITEIYFAAAAFLYGYWLKPFVLKKKGAFTAAFLYWGFSLMGRYIDAWEGFGRFTTVLAIVIPVIVLWILDDKRNLKQKVFLCTVYLLIRWLPFEMFTEIGSYEKDLIMQTELFTVNVTAIYAELIIWELIQFGMSLLILYFAIRILLKFYRKKRDDLSLNEFIMLLIPAGSMLMVRPIMYSYFLLWMECIKNGSRTSNVPGDAFRILFCILSYLSILVIIILYQQIKEKQDEMFAGKTLEREILDMERHFGQIEGMYDDIRSIRHDIGNHLSVINALADNRNITELKQYIGEWKGNFDGIQGSVRTGNVITDVVLSEYAESCGKEGIPFKTDFHYPEGFEVNVFDISVILNNALLNALEASKGLQSSGISIMSVRHDNVFIINVKNRISARVAIGEDGLPETTKNGGSHGYGLRNIRNTARKYKGDLEIRQETKEDGIYFILNVMMVE